jgi:hypothetical protein
MTEIMDDEINLILQPDTWKFREFEIPERMRPIPGRFLQAVICNDLKEACGQADNENIHQLPAYVAYFYNHAPHNCWGSRDIMMAWHKRGGSLELKRGDT